jgi:hypothetical protein
LYTYDPKRSLTVDNCIEVLLAAHEFEIEALVSAAASVVVCNIDAENVESVFQLATRYEWRQIVMWCLLYMSQHLDELKDLDNDTKKQIDFFLAN